MPVQKQQTNKKQKKPEREPKNIDTRKCSKFSCVFFSGVTNESNEWLAAQEAKFLLSLCKSTYLLINDCSSCFCSLPLPFIRWDPWRERKKDFWPLFSGERGKYFLPSNYPTIFNQLWFLMVTRLNQEKIRLATTTRHIFKTFPSFHLLLILANHDISSLKVVCNFSVY